MSDVRIHPDTGEELRRGVRPQIIHYGSLSREVDVPGWYPVGDGDALFTGADLQVSNTAFKELRSEYGGHVKKVRKARGLTQVEAGRIVGGGSRAFQKYESGTTPPSEAAIGLIEVLDKHPEALATLRAVRAKMMTAVLTATGSKKPGSSSSARNRRRKSAAKATRARA